MSVILGYDSRLSAVWMAMIVCQMIKKDWGPVCNTIRLCGQGPITRKGSWAGSYRPLSLIRTYAEPMVALVTRGTQLTQLIRAHNPRRNSGTHRWLGWSSTQHIHSLVLLGSKESVLPILHEGLNFQHGPGRRRNSLVSRDSSPETRPDGSGRLVGPAERAGETGHSRRKIEPSAGW